MTTQQLEAKLTSNIKSFLKAEGHVKTGRLLNKIEINVTNNEKLKISVEGLDYMLYLDDGAFLQDFFDLTSTTALIEEYLATQIEDGVGE